ncbi:hypothetical protein [Kitasatospora cheerisanensis]|uniref:hypothetical protein n=1 Tax=Kitasatospora cheerisanensis TaxID=81942 RepID=UPI000B1F8650|nr:hypothetical protein [Kitasatospora cheerisanensis]
MTEAAEHSAHRATAQTLRQLTGDPAWTALLDGAPVRRHPIGSTLLRQGESGQHVR